MTEGGGSDNRGGDSRRPDGGGGDRPRLRAVAGPLSEVPAPPPVRLVREYKGLTVADMMRDEIVDRLPSQARRMLHCVQRGDYEGAERALPGEFAAVLQGPRGARAAGWRFWLWLLFTVALVAMTLITWGT